MNILTIHTYDRLTRKNKDERLVNQTFLFLKKIIITQTLQSDKRYYFILYTPKRPNMHRAILRTFIKVDLLFVHYNIPRVYHLEQCRWPLCVRCCAGKRSEVYPCLQNCVVTANTLSLKIAHPFNKKNLHLKKLSFSLSQSQ